MLIKENIKRLPLHSRFLSITQLYKPMVEGSFIGEIVSSQKRTICLLQ